MSSNSVVNITEKKLTTLGKLSIVWKLLRVILTGISTTVTYPFVSASIKQPTLFKELTRRTLKTLVGISDALQLQYTLPTSTQVYKAWMASEARKRGVPTDAVTETLEDGSKLHWIGKKDAKKIIVHFHSGGFALPLQLGNINLIDYFRQEVSRRSRIDVKLAFLEYTLTPHATYPTQFHQAITAVRHVLSSGVSPSDIILSGDSAGGMLILQTLAHIIHPHPTIPRLEISTPFAGILTISPWVDLAVSGPSFDENTSRDVIDANSLRPWAALIKEGTKQSGRTPESERNWLEAAKAPSDWWIGTSQVTKNVILLYGTREVLKDGILRFVQNFKEGVEPEGVHLQIVTEKEGMHIGPCIEMGKGLPPSNVVKILAGWVHERFTT